MGAKCRKGKIQLVFVNFTHLLPVFWFFLFQNAPLCLMEFHRQLMMLLTFIFLFVDKFYIYWESILISCLEYQVLR